MANVREIYQVQLTRPHGVRVEEMKAYIEEAVSMWSRGGDPDNPKWDIGYFPITVKRIRNQESSK